MAILFRMNLARLVNLGSHSIPIQAIPSNPDLSLVSLFVFLLLRHVTLITMNSCSEEYAQPTDTLAHGLLLLSNCLIIIQSVVGLLHLIAAF
jgi:hypothetical protein